MNNNKRHTELLKRLSQDTITEKEKWELERASLDDAFLADALEGYYNNPGRHDLSRMPISKTEPIQRKLIRKWIGVAASLLILFSISYWAFNSTNDKTPILSTESVKVEGSPQFDVPSAEELEQSNELVASESEYSILKIDDNTTFIEFNDEEIVPEQKVKPIKESTPTKDQKENQKRNKRVVGNTSKKERSNTVINKNVSSKLESDDSFQEVPVFQNIEENDMVMTKTVEDLDRLPLKMIKGNVRDFGGTPIANVKLTPSDGSNPVVTNYNGDFKMELLEQEDVSIIATADGFVPQKFKAKSNLDINLQKAEKSLSDAPKRLAEFMTPEELKIHYKKVLSNYMEQHNITLCSETFENWKNIKLSIAITKDNNVDKITFKDNIDQSCQMSIENIVRQAGFENIFDGSKKINFDFILRKL